MRRLTVLALAIAALAVPSAGRADGFGWLSESYRAVVAGGGVVSDGFGLAAVNPGPDQTIGTGDDSRDPSPSSSGIVTIAGIPEGASVTKAFLYWSVLATDDAAVLFDGQPLLGSMIGRSQETCWFNINTPIPDQDNRVYRSDVTSLVEGNGSYAVSGIVDTPPGYAQGASLVVVYSDPNDFSTTLVVIDDGAISGGLPGPQMNSMSHTFTNLGLDHTPMSARLHTGMADANPSYRDGVMTFAGTAVTPEDYFAGSDGGLYDDTTIDLSTSLLPAGTTSVDNEVEILDDCLLWVYSTLEVQNEPPPVTILKPAPGTYIASSAVEISGRANSEVTNVRLTSGTSTIATAPATNGTWSASPSLPDGTYTVVATGLDDNSVALAPAVEVTFTIDTQGPAVDITAPNMATVSLGAIQVRGTADDNIGVARIVVTAESVLLGETQTLTANCLTCGAPSVMWDARLQLQQAGVYLLTATGYDIAGNATTSDALVIIVQAIPD